MIPHFKEAWETKKRDGNDYKGKDYMDKICTRSSKSILLNDR